MIEVLVVDDHDVVRQGLALLLNTYDDVEVAGVAADGETAVEQALVLEPDVVLMDLSMPGIGGIEATRRINEQQHAAVVILTTFGDSSRVMLSLDAGAVGYLMKDCAPQDLHAGIVAAARGGSPLDPRVARTLLEARRTDIPGERAGAELTGKQTEVLLLVAEGLPNRLIARRMGISEKTVKAHLTRVFQVLGVTDRVQAALWAKRHL